ncbi:MAG: hypothetical protein GXY17_05155 [Clostridiaceae bacterium]|jgi:hypothetical protein|nr:hypothetical protein [Clostridiaceae bacterium]
MKMDQLVLSSLNITEDQYHFKGQFILKASGKSKSVDLEELAKPSVLEGIKAYFDLDEPTKEIESKLMDMVMEKAHIGSKIVEGENYDESARNKKMERLAKNLDIS